MFLNVMPQLLLFLQMLWACCPIEKGAGDNRGDFHMVEQVVAQIRLVNPLNHDLFIDRLVMATDKIAVKIDGQVVHGFHSLQGQKDKEIVHIEGVLWQL